MTLRPFFSFFGGKWRAARRYPPPKYLRIVEPFAGSAGYSLRYPDREVVLVERDPIIAELWRFLTRVTPEEVRRIPLVEAVDDLPGWVPEGARSLVGFWLNQASTRPGNVLSAGMRRLASGHYGIKRNCAGWTETVRERVASQVPTIRHWTILEGEYHQTLNLQATWFVDPPYIGGRSMGRNYVHGCSGIDYVRLATWCRERWGQVIACEAEGATWLPFEPLGTMKAGPRSSGSPEVVWVHER